MGKPPTGGDCEGAHPPPPAPGPPRWLTAAAFAAAALLLFFPLHVPYQNPDQDLPVSLSLIDFVRGGWSPISLHFPSALTNVMRAVYGAALAGLNLGGASLDRAAVLAAWPEHHQLYRILPRAIAMASGMAALTAVWGLARMVGGGWSGLIALLLLATAPGFVREHHHGMFDAPPAAAIAALLWASGAHVRSGSLRSIAGAGALLGVAFSCKQNSAIAAVALLAALVAAPGSLRAKLGHAVAAGAAALAAVLVLSPAVLLEPGRFLWYLRVHLTLLYAAGQPRLLEDAPPPHRLWDVLWYGVGLPTLALAALGSARTLARRERRLLPVLVFVVAYGAIAARSHLVLNRYALPLLPALALLAAYALLAVRRPSLRAALVAAALVVQVPATVSYLRLLASEDTRVAAARWLRGHVAPDAPVFLPGGPLWSAYVAPDLPRPLTLPRQLDPGLARAIAERMPPTFPRHWRWATGLRRAPADEGDRDPLAEFAGGVVVTAEHPSPRFTKAMTSARLVEALEQGAVLLADFPIESSPGRALPVYEPADLNFAPVAGARLLLRPGPHIRIWSVPAPAARPVPGSTGAAGAGAGDGGDAPSDEIRLPGLVDVGAAEPDVRIELKYATADNFLGRDVYAGLRRCFLVPEAAAKIAAAAALLRERAPETALLLYDCARPRRVQKAMWALVEGTPREPYVANPYAPPGSVHNRGCAVDLTLADRTTGRAIEMGTPFDFFGERAEPTRELAFFAQGEISPQALANRLLLREVMVRSGFRPLANEWWHFDCEDAAVASGRYPIIE
jgi:zinc D-Ala-D-Ala dipeptidase